MIKPDSLHNLIALLKVNEHRSARTFEEAEEKIGYGRGLIFCFLFLMPLFNVNAMKVAEYLAKRGNYHTTIYLSGYFEAIYESIPQLGGCYRQGIKKSDMTYEDLKPQLDLLIKRQMEKGVLIAEDEMDDAIKPLFLQTLNCKEADALKPEPEKPVKQTAKPVKQPVKQNGLHKSSVKQPPRS